MGSHQRAALMPDRFMPLTPAYTLAAFCRLLLSATPASPQNTLDAVDRYVRSELVRQRIPSLSVAILRGDSVLLARGYGEANVELGVPASDSTIYQSGSLGKQFTSALVVMLAEAGRLGLDDSIARWFPEASEPAGSSWTPSRPAARL